MLNIVLFGPPGSGKGTQSETLIKDKGLVHLSTGDLLRNEIANQTALGLEAKKLMDNGVLVPDEVVVGMIKNKFKENPDAKGFIFDGFPRTVKQAEALDVALKEYSWKIDKVLFLQVPDNLLIERLLNRGKDSGRPDDANEDKIKTRLQEYKDKTLPVANYYSAQNKCVEVDGVGLIEEIYGRINSALDS